MTYDKCMICDGPLPCDCLDSPTESPWDEPYKGTILEPKNRRSGITETRSAMYYVLTDSTPSAKRVAGPFFTRQQAWDYCDERHEAVHALTVRTKNEIEALPSDYANAILNAR